MLQKIYMVLLTSSVLFPNCLSSNDIDTLARVVYGEARGESPEGQLAVAYSAVNRVSHPGYANNLNEVLHKTYKGRDGKTYHEYNTLDSKTHDRNFASAKSQNTKEYQNAIQASRDAISRTKPDPTSGATDYCAHDPCSATASNKYWEAYDKIKIGNHYFVKRKPAKQMSKHGNNEL